MRRNLRVRINGTRSAGDTRDMTPAAQPTPSVRVPLLLPLLCGLLFSGCGEQEELVPDDLEQGSQELDVGSVVEFNNFRDSDGDGIADGLGRNPRISGKARDVRFSVVNGEQRVHVQLADCPPAPAPCGFGATGDARAILTAATRRARGGEYYKGWMLGTGGGAPSTGCCAARTPGTKTARSKSRSERWDPPVVLHRWRARSSRCDERVLRVRGTRAATLGLLTRVLDSRLGRRDPQINALSAIGAHVNRTQV